MYTAFSCITAWNIMHCRSFMDSKQFYIPYKRNRKQASSKSVQKPLNFSTFNTHRSTQCPFNLLAPCVLYIRTGVSLLSVLETILLNNCRMQLGFATSQLSLPLTPTIPHLVNATLCIISYSTTNKMHLFLKLFVLVKRSTCFRRSFCPSSGAQNCTYSNRHVSDSCC